MLSLMLHLREMGEFKFSYTAMTAPSRVSIEEVLFWNWRKQSSPFSLSFSTISQMLRSYLRNRRHRY